MPVFSAAELANIVQRSHLSDVPNFSKTLIGSATSEDLANNSGWNFFQPQANRALVTDADAAMSDITYADFLALMRAQIADVDAGTLTTDADLPFAYTLADVVIDGEITITGVSGLPSHSHTWEVAISPANGAADSVTFDPTAFYPLDPYPADLTTDQSKKSFYVLKFHNDPAYPLVGYAKIGDV